MSCEGLLIHAVGVGSANLHLYDKIDKDGLLLTLPRDCKFFVVFDSSKHTIVYELPPVSLN